MAGADIVRGEPLLILHGSEIMARAKMRAEHNHRIGPFHRLECKGLGMDSLLPSQGIWDRVVM